MCETRFYCIPSARNLSVGDADLITWIIVVCLTLRERSLYSLSPYEVHAVFSLCSGIALVLVLT